MNQKTRTKTKEEVKRTRETTMARQGRKQSNAARMDTRNWRRKGWRRMDAPRRRKTGRTNTLKTVLDTAD